MPRTTKRRSVFLVSSALCAVISGIAFGGVILRDDLTGRLIFGAAWAALAVVWLGIYFGGFSGRPEGSPEDDRTR